MIDFTQAFEDINNSDLSPWMTRLPKDIDETLANYRHGELEKWQQLLAGLIKVAPSHLELKDEVKVGTEQSLTKEQKAALREQLMVLHPWRKGPFNINGLHINTEWRSDWKWQRIEPHITDLRNRTILDVGCGNVYHLFRMQGAGAKLSIGIDPSQKFLAQFSAIKHFLGQMPVHLLPLGIEAMPSSMPLFDTVFSMGVLYHRRSPIEHIQKLKELLRPGGELVLETLVVDGDKETVFLPDGRYAQMRNVWFLPSVAALSHWMKRCGLKNVRVIDCSRTTTDEQRATDWMHFHSLENYLDPEDPNRTIEGHPGPVRATIIANA
ncbi:MAG: tRNA 5-methoxyuridine(34)/uridine 5-oxyacetic acid(34) synthase CmoB [Gammaproteobacteria bacterium]|nr:MAG: tRNA 5-methoxyuridine(34)/uridine 5-oxyacetic acid(34) synthase CmoB [Gammaproteobacteria bacterium]